MSARSADSCINIRASWLIIVLINGSFFRSFYWRNSHPWISSIFLLLASSPLSAVRYASSASAPAASLTLLLSPFAALAGSFPGASSPSPALSLFPSARIISCSPCAKGQRSPYTHAPPPLTKFVQSLVLYLPFAFCFCTNRSCLSRSISGAAASSAPASPLAFALAARTRLFFDLLFLPFPAVAASSVAVSKRVRHSPSSTEATNS
mmetsp:Transcript_17831/g.58325  ORF Transcript_17831/g.58325 Transcript_17831/m.58325 type:complete len:207 (+) Transcript_17831:895-1515(+)